MKDIFEKYSLYLKYNRKIAIDITDIRKKLAYKYTKSGEFEINSPGDSMEALSALLNAVHDSEVNSKSDSSNIICKPKCPSHAAFELVVEETLNCQCGASNKHRWDYSTFSHHFYVHELFEDLKNSDPSALLVLSRHEEVACLEVSSIMKCEGRLHEYMRGHWEKSEVPVCPSECKQPKSHKVLRLLSYPQVFVINIIWKEFRQDPLRILQAYASIPYTISLDAIYEGTQPTNHVLKSVIAYGAGHYISAVRASNKKVWYKIDDENSRLIGEGSWKEFVKDSVRSRFYPVGLFYEESSKRDNHKMNASEWIDLEIEVLESSKNHEEPQTQSAAEWKCECGVENDYNWRLCKACFKIRPDINGWVCEKCTFLNENTEAICTSCGIGSKWKRNSGALDIYWHCEKCGRKNHKSETKCCCEQATCKICGDIVKGNCTKCYSGYECKLCNGFIPKQDGLLCYRCKTPTVSKRCLQCNIAVNFTTFVCKLCSDSLWKCLKCAQFNFPSTEFCSNSGCLGKKAVSKVIETKSFNEEMKNKVTSPTVHRNGVTQSKPERPKPPPRVEKGICVGCGDRLNPKFLFCIKCRIKTQEKICRFCRVTTADNLCEECIYISKVCQKCKKEFCPVLNAMCPECV